MALAEPFSSYLKETNTKIEKQCALLAVKHHSNVFLEAWAWFEREVDEATRILKQCRVLWKRSIFHRSFSSHDEEIELNALLSDFTNKLEKCWFIISSTFCNVPTYGHRGRMLMRDMATGRALRSFGQLERYMLAYDALESVDGTAWQNATILCDMIRDLLDKRAQPMMAVDDPLLRKDLAIVGCLRCELQNITSLENKD